jgi:RNA polymerase sigma factor (sigma-70 family)
MNDKSLTPEAEQALLRQFASKGDPQAFSLIARHYAGLVYGACLRITGNQEQAADTAQETFFHLALHGREVSGSLAGWLHRVAVRKAVNVVRSEIARRRREQAYAAVPRESEQWTDVSPLVDEAMLQLDEELRDILVRYYLNDETLTSIAAAKGISQPTASRRVETALEQLRLNLKSKGVLVGALTLGGLMSNAAISAPAAVLAELGKMGLATSGAAAASSATATVLGLNAKLVVAAAVAVVGVGGYVAYRSMQPPEAAQPAATAPVTVMVTAPKGDSTAAVSVDPTAPAAALSSLAPAPITVVSTGPAPMRGVAAAQSVRGGVSQSGGVSYGSMAMGSGLGFAGYSTEPPATLATTEGALRLFADALARGDPARWMDCFDGTVDANPLRRALESPATDAERELQQVLRSLGPPVEVVQTTETEDGLKVKWKATVRQPFTTADNGVTKNWQRADRYELELRLKQIGGEWKIVGF